MKPGFQVGMANAPDPICGTNPMSGGRLPQSIWRRLSHRRLKLSGLLSPPPSSVPNGDGSDRIVARPFSRHPAGPRSGRQIMRDIEARLLELGLGLPEASNPAANYTNCVQTGNLLYVSGKGPPPDADGPIKGRLGREFSTEEGYELARRTALDILAAVRLELGTLDRVERVVKLQGFVNSTPEFEEHPQVLNGASDLMVQVFGSSGVHSRSVLGATSLRAGLPIVIESIFEVRGASE